MIDLCLLNVVFTWTCDLQLHFYEVSHRWTEGVSLCCRQYLQAEILISVYISIYYGESTIVAALSINNLNTKTSKYYSKNDTQ